MAYEPTEWKCGDVITAEALNKLEGGVAEAIECCGSGGGILAVTASIREATTEECPSGGSVIEYSHSWQEIYNAFYGGTPVFCATPAGTLLVIAVDASPYLIWCLTFDGESVIPLDIAFPATGTTYISCNAPK